MMEEAMDLRCGCISPGGVRSYWSPGDSERCHGTADEEDGLCHGCRVMCLRMSQVLAEVGRTEREERIENL